MLRVAYSPNSLNMWEFEPFFASHQKDTHLHEHPIFGNLVNKLSLPPAKAPCSLGTILAEAQVADLRGRAVVVLSNHENLSQQNMPLAMISLRLHKNHGLFLIFGVQKTETCIA